MLLTPPPPRYIAQHAIEDLNRRTPLKNFFYLPPSCTDLSSFSDPANSPLIVCVFRELLQAHDEDKQTNSFFFINTFLENFVGLKDDGEVLSAMIFEKRQYAYVQGVTKILLPGFILESDMCVRAQ